MTAKSDGPGAAPRRWAAVPVRTELITPGTDLPTFVQRYTQGIAEAGDILCLAESAVAIGQGRAVRPSDVRPGALARFLSRFPHPDGSLATPAAMQLAIREAGVPKILAGAAAAAVGRALCRRGWFYRVAGHALAQIDDIAGTLAPFENFIVLGPFDPQQTAEKVRQATGLHTAIVDVDDASHVDILALTGGIEPEELFLALLGNPQGNDDQQTPLVVLKRLTVGEEAPAQPARSAPARTAGGITVRMGAAHTAGGQSRIS
ncbi:MAG: coenzyme F420-0:L-glutamate ligase [Bacillota bacterium]